MKGYYFNMKKKIVYLIIFFFIFISNYVFANYKTVIDGIINVELKNSIFMCNNSELQIQTMNSIENNSFENTFNIMNFIEEENLINEINFEYTIKIVPSNNNFPVKYKLIDLNNNCEISLNSNLESSTLELGTNKEQHNYKLIVYWDMDNVNQNLEENLDVGIQVKGVQKQA